MPKAAPLLVIVALGLTASAAEFYPDVLPVLQKHCQSCHEAGDIGPMPLTSYSEVRPWASAIREAVKLKKMPPWFVESTSGPIANDPRLSEAEVRTIDEWVSEGAPEGKRPKSSPHKAAPPEAFSADLSVATPHPFRVPANSVIDYQYFVVRLPFTYDRWIRGVEVRPSDRSVVHHAVVFIRPPGSAWLREAPGDGTAWAPPATDAAAVAKTRATTEDILAVYTPGTRGVRFPEGMAKLIPAGSDLVLQVHYTSKKTDATDQISVGLMMAEGTPKKRLLTLQMGRDDLRIPPNAADYTATISGTLPKDTVLVSLTPHMHLRGSAFEFEAFAPGGRAETLLRVKPYDFFWQFTYLYAQPRMLPKGTILKWTGHFDNSKNNPRNPDPSAEVTWGEQSTQEMMIGFFDVAVDPGTDKQTFFSRR